MYRRRLHFYESDRLAAVPSASPNRDAGSFHFERDRVVRGIGARVCQLIAGEVVGRWVTEQRIGDLFLLAVADLRQAVSRLGKMLQLLLKPRTDAAVAPPRSAT